MPCRVESNQMPNERYSLNSERTDCEQTKNPCMWAHRAQEGAHFCKWLPKDVASRLYISMTGWQFPWLYRWAALDAEGMFPGRFIHHYTLLTAQMCGYICHEFVQAPGCSCEQIGVKYIPSWQCMALCPHMHEPQRDHVHVYAYTSHYTDFILKTEILLTFLNAITLYYFPIHRYCFLTFLLGFRDKYRKKIIRIQ